MEQFTVIGDGLLVRAPAKINLSLLIAGKRADGYHDIETIMAKINWYDEILIEPGEKSGIELICKGSYWAPQGQENLVYRACEMILKQAGVSTNLKVTLTKNIPAGSGLGSASSDAAATLLGVNKLLNLKLEREKLEKMASELGSDVAFFLDGPLAFCTGRGEKIKKLNLNFDFLAVLFLPDVSVSTKRVYENYTHDVELYKGLKIQINALLEKNRVDLITKMCANMLECSSFGSYDELAEYEKRIESLGVGPICLSGSGSTMYCIVDMNDRQKAEMYHNMVEMDAGCKSLIVNNNRW